MRTRLALPALAMMLTAIGQLSTTPAQAHHSFAPYEPTLQIKLSGVVTEFRWLNPHVYIGMDAPDPKTGEKKHWLVEGASRKCVVVSGMAVLLSA